MASDNWSKYELLAEDDPTSITWASRGGDGSGKSYFGCTAVPPIWVCAFDPHGMSRVDKGIRAGKEIRIGRYGFNANIFDGNRAKIRQAAQDVWKKFVDEYRTALKNARTVLWDREDLAWELIRYYSFGGDKNEGSRTGALDYGDLNAEYVGLIQEAKDAKVNLGLLQGVKEKWVAKFNPEKGKMQNYCTGDMIPDGFKKIADHVDITLDHFWDPKKKEYVVKIGKFPNKEYKDQEIANLSFGEMALTAFPDSDISNWV
jgi:hypothetical protein